MKKINILKPVLVSNKERALQNRKLFDRMHSLVINIISSPGAGKTSVIYRVVERLRARYRILIIEGDIRGQVDSQRLKKLKVDVVQINTETACHLDAYMIAQALPTSKKKYDLVLVENVGNLVCPAEFEIGEDYKLAILSTPEGDDKPFKYPLLFHLAQVVIINKIDLLSYTDFNLKKAVTQLKKQNPKVRIIVVSAKTGNGIEEVCDYIIEDLNARKKKSHN
ncbi:hydrogenase accessory protein HypB [candidate division WOR-3 bacterium RBG_13_43_14]|uniref:Hydrogenase accessory protein HypB n=1 Tax=candidate division WOR-3 bacterium RBG_13_43_14 TaxID=1802590 RepID=A0A1F4UEV0_UNCW3|nr:MAG: hydrogenase accessory protein HypB [candidate division WOR-3 bacterium RBG_13_43_14]